MHFRLRSVMLLLTKSSRVLAQHNPSLITFHQLQTSTSESPETPDYLYFHKALKEMVPIELSMIFFLIFLILFLVAYIFYKYIKSTRMRTTLVLEISDGEQSQKWTIQSLSLAPAFYKFNVDRQNIRLVLVSSIQGAQLLWGNGLTVFNAVAEIPVALRQEIRIPFWRTTALRRLLKSRYFVMMHVLGTKNELLELILLRDFMVPELYMSTSMAEVSRPTGVYPSLTVA